MKPWIAVPATLALVYRAWSRNSLTPLGIFVAALTAVAHAVHPWSVFFALLVVFFLSGTTVTKVKHDVKAKLTHSSSGSPGGEGPRTHVQVLANSVVASVLILAHAWVLKKDGALELCWHNKPYQRAADVLVAGIVANYTAVAADTFSSELGILAKAQPRLITAPWKKVAPGTNGGVTVTGILAGFLGSFIVAATATALMPFCEEGSSVLSQDFSSSGWTTHERLNFMLAMTAIGVGGSLFDSLLGAVFQASVIDIRTGKVIEGEGGAKVLVRSTGSMKLKQSETAFKDKEHHESRKVATGMDILSNNGVNLLMAATMSALAIVGASWLWNLSLSQVLSELQR
ncbi:uncharacterized protein PV09_02479 [Verruconis gallopava]|uniref:TIGR00297 family protein n=1 Tax=Verruconis gallopava TaxID=253628 RepID=A0A0D2B6D5_9PEZI|nr:uncharacterized protein PV09_02479 [Verruconis gallopava]KIW06799.1 hypothetical protein PV09_02479 [Verruconis gallopava]